MRCVRFGGGPPRGQARILQFTWKTVLFFGGAGHHLDTCGHFSGDDQWMASAWSSEKRGGGGRGVPRLMIPRGLAVGLRFGIWVDPGRPRRRAALRGWCSEQKGKCLDVTVAPAVVCRPCRSGPGAAACRLSRAESERRCRAPGQPPGGALCHGRGRCDCGVCICHVSEPGVYFGPLCECHEWVCETYDGSTCAGKGARRRALRMRSPGGFGPLGEGEAGGPSHLHPRSHRREGAGPAFRQSVLESRLLTPTSCSRAQTSVEIIFAKVHSLDYKSQLLLFLPHYRPNLPTSP